MAPNSKSKSPFHTDRMFDGNVRQTKLGIIFALVSVTIPFADNWKWFHITHNLMCSIVWDQNRCGTEHQSWALIQSQQVHEIHQCITPVLYLLQHFQHQPVSVHTVYSTEPSRLPLTLPRVFMSAMVCVYNVFCSIEHCSQSQTCLLSTRTRQPIRGI